MRSFCTALVQLSPNLKTVYFRLEATKSAILPELVELTNDEESYVRIAGLETVVNILTLVDEGMLKLFSFIG